jgi:hypothetical protein
MTDAMTNHLHLLPARIASQILADVDGRPYFADSVLRYHTMDDAELLRVTEVCLRNLGRLEREEGPDADLRHVLVPELWERITPNVGVRDRLRRISTTLAEYDPDPERPSLWGRWDPERTARLRAEAERLRRQIAEMAVADTSALVEQVRFTIAGSDVSRHWAPTQFVYEPGFVYRVVPAVACRLGSRRPQRTP